MALVRLMIYLSLVVAAFIWAPLGLALVVAAVIGLLAPLEIYAAHLRGKRVLAMRTALGRRAPDADLRDRNLYRDLFVAALWAGLVTNTSGPSSAFPDGGARDGGARDDGFDDHAKNYDGFDGDPG